MERGKEAYGKTVPLNIVEVQTPDTDAQLVAENIAAQLEKRISHRRAMKNCHGPRHEMRRHAASR